MITLKQKIYNPNITLADVLSKFTKPRLKGILSRLGRKLSSSVTKDVFVYMAQAIILKRPEDILNTLSVESVYLLAELVHEGEGTFLAYPHVNKDRDIQNMGLVLTYLDCGDATQYLVLSKDVRDVFAPIIDDYIANESLKLQRTVEPYILGLSNFLGLCPLPLLEDTLKRDGVEISRQALMKCCNRAVYDELITVDRGSAPVPYEELDEEITYIPSPYFDTEKERICQFLDMLKNDGIIHKKYREFTREEILTAGRFVPDFKGEFAELLKNIYRTVGYSDARIASILVDFWQSHVYDDQENERRCKHLNDENLQLAYEEFCKVVPRWVCKGFCDTLTEGEFDEMDAVVEVIAKQLKEKFENLPSSDSPEVKFGSVFTHHPEEKNVGEEIEQEVIFKKIVRFTMHHKEDTYWQAYLICEGETSRLVANFGHAFDFISAPYKDGDSIDISRATEKKYPLFAKLAPIYDTPARHKPYLNTIGFNGNPKTWCLMQILPIDPNEWFDIAFGQLVGAYNEAFDETLNKFYEISVALLRELMRSDSKKAQEGVKELLGITFIN
jgi:hypothetical protein